MTTAIDLSIIRSSVEARMIRAEKMVKAVCREFTSTPLGPGPITRRCDLRPFAEQSISLKLAS
jgi:hypothetical protein